MRGVGEDRDKAQARTQDRVTIQEAARRLGVKEDAIRKRIQRGTLRHKKSPEGRVYVWIDSAQDASWAASRVTYQDASSELVEELRDRVRYLERVLEEERRRRDTFMAELMRRIPAIGAPRSEESAGEPPGTP